MPTELLILLIIANASASSSSARIQPNLLESTRTRAMVMRLKQKSALTVLGSFIAFGIAAFAFFHFYLIREFTKLEDQQASRNIGRVSEALRQEIRALIERSRDWAVWDDAYSFVVDHNPEFVESNLTYEAVKSIQFDHIIFLSKPDKISYAIQLDFTNETAGALSESAMASLVTTSAFAPVLEGAVPGGGIVEIDGITYLAAASPITDSAESKTPNGILVFTRRLSDDIITRIGEQTRLSVTRSTVAVTTPKKRTSTAERLDPANAFVLKNISRGERELVGELAAYDLFGNNVFTLQIPMQRDLFFQGIRIRNYIAVGLGILGLLTAAAVILLAHKLVIERVSIIGKELGSIANQQLFSKRISVLGSDELAQLAQSINHTLESLDGAQQDSVKSRQLAETANAAKSMFIAKVSHELRGSIGCITGMHRIALKKDPSRAVKELVEVADKSAWNLLSILNEILDYSKAESGNLTLEKIEFEPRAVIRETMELISGRLEDRIETELLLELDPNLPRLLRGDPLKLKQILVNLLGNAVKFTPKGFVGLRVNLKNTTSTSVVLKLDVWDTGIGISKQQQGTIFEPFKQADESVERKYQGTGLGLAIVKHFTEAMGGSVAVESVPQNGTCFTLEMPFALVGKAQRDLEKRNSHRPPLLLIAEYSPVTTALLRCLVQPGVEIIHRDILVADDKPSVMQEIRRASVLVVTEKSLADVSVLQAVCSLASQTQKRVVALVRTSSVELRDQLYTAGIKTILPCPALAEDIIAACDRPLQDEEETVTDLPLSAPLGRKLRILVADDAPTNRIIIADILEEAGHDVTMVSDGQELLSRLSPGFSNKPGSEQFDVILTDISMPILDGYTLTRVIRELERQNICRTRLPIIAITAHAMKEEEVRLKAAGIDSIVTKPIRSEALLSALDALVNRRSTK